MPSLQGYAGRSTMKWVGSHGSLPIRTVPCIALTSSTATEIVPAPGVYRSPFSMRLLH